MDNQPKTQQSEQVDINGLLPVPEDQRAMNAPSYVLCFWSTAIIIQVATIGTYMLQDGMNFWQLILVGIISGLLVAFFATVNSAPGLKDGIPFVVQIRSSFGYTGAKVVYWLRIIPAICWYRIGSWIGALAIDQVMITLFNMNSMPFLWLGVLTVVHIILGWKGVSQIAWFNAVVSLVIVVVLSYFFYVVFRDGSLDFTPYIERPWDWGFTFFAAISAATANWATVMLNNSDLTRQLRPGTMKNSFISNVLGIFPPWQLMVCFGMFIFIATGNDDPIVGLMALAPNQFMGILLLIFIVLAQITSNLTTSLLPAALALRDTFKISWQAGAVISSLLSVITFPWVLFDAEWFFVFQNVYSSFLGPMLGIMICDFWIVSKRKCDVDGLYKPETKKYQYYKGFSISAFVTLIICAIISFVNLGVAWLIGWPCSFVFYYILKVILKLDDKFSIKN